MGTLAGLPSLNPKLDKETKELITLLGGINNHSLAKIIYTTKGIEYTPAFLKDGTPDLKKDGTQKMTKKGFLKTGSSKNPRPLTLLQPDGSIKSVKEINALTMVVINVGHDYVKMIKNQLKKLGKNPDDFNPEACRYSKRFSNNGLVRQNINPAKDRTFYFRYFTGVNGITYQTYEVIYLNELDQVIELTEDYKKEWFGKSAPSKKQLEAGIEKEIKPRNLGLDNLIYFQKGESVFNDRVTSQIMKLLDLRWV